MPAQWLIETGDGEALPLWSQAVLGVGGALLLACTLFICYVRKREMKNTPIWSNLETIQQVASMPSDQVGTANYAMAAVSRGAVKPACELTPAVSQSNTERSQGDMSLHS